MISWVCTVHKVKGLRLTSGVVSFDFEKQTSLNEGQAYVALSRVISIYNLFLIGKYICNVFKVKVTAVVEYSRLRENRFNTVYTDDVDCNILTVSLLNTRFINRYATDISRARHLTENNILCLTESQIKNYTDVAENKQQLSTFVIHFNSCGARHQNLAFCVIQNIALSKYEAFLGISVIDITNNSFLHNAIWIMLLYRSPSSSFTIIFNTSENLLSDRHIIDIVLGDFKGNAQFLFLCNPQKSSVNVCPMKILKSTITKKVIVCFYNLGEKKI